MVIDFKQYLPTGKANAINAKHLQAKIGVNSDREVRQCVEAARLAGQLICSGNAGYYLPASREEIREYVNRIEAQAKSMFAILKTARAVLNDNSSLFIGDSAAEGAADQLHEPHTAIEQPAVHEKVAAPADKLNELRERFKR